MKLPSIKGFVITRTRKFFNVSSYHSNKLVDRLIDETPEFDFFRRRRPRYVLADELDDITRILPIANVPRLRTTA